MEWKRLPNLFTRKFLKNKYFWLYLACGGLVLFSTVLGLFMSSVSIPVPVIAQIVVHKLFGWGWGLDIPDTIQMIIWDIRLPRVMLAFGVGAALALAGATFQGLLRNPLADPFTIGVSSGAALGAVVVLFFQITLLGSYTLPIFAIVGGFLSLGIVYTITSLSSRSMAVETIILAGIIVSSFISSLIILFISLSGEELRQILYWLMGSVGMRGWSHVQLFLPFLVLGMIITLFHYRELNALALGEDSAQHIGMDVYQKKIWILIGASLLTGASVAVSGTIGFVGLVIPHLVRLVAGSNHSHVLPLSMLIGGSFLVLADLVARTAIAPQELPIGVITALIGAPVFALLLIRERWRKGWVK